jgi:hypothetical protein
LGGDCGSAAAAAAVALIANPALRGLLCCD